MNTKVRSYNQLALHVNCIIAQRPDDLSLDQVRDAAHNHCLVQLLHKSYPFADLYYFIYKPTALHQLEAGLADAASWLSWQEPRRIGPSNSGLALAMAINRIVEWSAIERCRADYQIERVHLEAEAVCQHFGSFSPSIPFQYSTIPVFHCPPSVNNPTPWSVINPGCITSIHRKPCLV